ncbi:MAG TPA: ABC transporter permease [Planctomycetaceae bacterium]|nr:ABC transporter permease [Planctomycetaceae bacterium]HRE99228.1 ABC transporter permease subunit [Pirellulaceae bacterium]
MSDLRDNPVLQRELLVNLRMPRAFVLLAIYQGLLALIVMAAWPRETRLDLRESPESARQLGDLFFLGQFVIASLMAPSFAAGAIAGEKERRTFEMLLASPLRPEKVVLGKIIASLTHLGLLVVTSLPIVVLCLPLGGISLYEVLAAYLAMLACLILFGVISLACSSRFRRTSAALVVSYLIILPLAALAVGGWLALRDQGALRLETVVIAVPAVAWAGISLLFRDATDRLRQPGDLGSEGKEVVDEVEEQRDAVGLVIDRERFPDRLFAPPRRDDLMEDGANPVYEKELHSEIFAQGTLMLRLVVQISMLLSIPMMAWALFFNPGMNSWYVCYVLLFALLVGPVFSAGSLTSERERQTLDLLLTTNISPWQILWGKLISGLRVATVLTGFLLWPLVLATVLVPIYWGNIGGIAAYVLLCAATCLAASVTAMASSTLMRKTTHAMLLSYGILLTLYAVPPAADLFVRNYLDAPALGRVTTVAARISPFRAAFDVPFDEPDSPREMRRRRTSDPADRWLLSYAPSDWNEFGQHLLMSASGTGLLIVLMLQAFRIRWRVADSSGG